MEISQNEALHIINALRLGTVPSRGLHHYAVGLERETQVLASELEEVGRGHSHIKGVRGDYGSGKTFLVSWLGEEALKQGYVASRVTLNRESVPLHQLERVYQQAVQNLAVRGVEGGALPYLLERWLDSAEDYAVSTLGISEDDHPGLQKAVVQRVQDLLGEVAREKPALATALAAYYQAHLNGDYGLKQQVLAWIAADVNASAKGIPGLKGRLERKDILAILRALVGMIRHLGFRGIVLIIDELDEMRKLRKDSRELSWSNLRDLIDQIGAGMPGMYLVLAGTPDVFDSVRGFKQLAPLYQRFEDATLQTPYPNLRGPQLRLPLFGQTQLVEAMNKLKDIWEVAYGTPSRIDPTFPAYLAQGWTQRLAQRSPRIAIREFIGVLDRLRDYLSFDPYSEYRFELDSKILTPEEQGQTDLEADF